MPSPEQLAILQSQIAPASVLCEKQVGLPAEVTAAQCILETGWLKHSPGNNCFGIKAYEGCYGRQLLFTREWFNEEELERFLQSNQGRTATLINAHATVNGRKEYSVQDWFAVFPSLGACFVYHAKLLLESPIYAQAFAWYKENGDQAQYVRSVARHYATDPQYAAQVLDLADSQQVKDSVAAARVNNSNV